MAASPTSSSNTVLGFQGPNAVEDSWTDQQPRYVMVAQDDLQRDQFIALGGPAGQCTFLVRAPWTDLGRFVERARQAGAEIVRMDGYPKDRTVRVVTAETPTREDVLPPAIVEQLKYLRPSFRRSVARVSAAPAQASLLAGDGGTPIDLNDTGGQPPVRDITSAFETLAAPGDEVAA
ncbi:MAG TPA: hypothetical protein VFA20_05490 [Myxococcaceae bacterium]|nr:hypothetical protein [Myxococcaceae bacterium]